MSTDAPLLKVDALAKRFCRDTARSLRYGVSDMLHELLPRRTSAPQLRPHEFWAIEGISFSIAPGEAVAIGGRNGAGKTTLLRLLAGLLKPDAGTISVNGSVNPVIELGQGLNPMLTGRENAEIGLAWRGQSMAAIRSLLPEVEAFAELGAMFDSPVHSYSAGMRVRLAFAIAISVPCDLLVLDEVLAVGDLVFQRKCIEHMQGHLARGGSMILVSHNPVQMQALCRRGILLDRGRMVFDGPVEDSIDLMYELQQGKPGEAVLEDDGDGPVRIDSATIVPETGNGMVTSGAAVIIEVQFTVRCNLDAICSFAFWTRDRSICVATLGNPGSERFGPGSHIRRCRIPVLPLSAGTYALRAAVSDPETLLPYATLGYRSGPIEFRVSEPLSRLTVLTRNAGQLVTIQHEWLGEADGAA